MASPEPHKTYEQILAQNIYISFKSTRTCLENMPTYFHGSDYSIGRCPGCEWSDASTSDEDRADGLTRPVCDDQSPEPWETRPPHDDRCIRHKPTILIGCQNLGSFQAAFRRERQVHIDKCAACQADIHKWLQVKPVCRWLLQMCRESTVVEEILHMLGHQMRPVKPVIDERTGRSSLEAMSGSSMSRRHGPTSRYPAGSWWTADCMVDILVWPAMQTKNMLEGEVADVELILHDGSYSHSTAAMHSDDTWWFPRSQ